MLLKKYKDGAKVKKYKVESFEEQPKMDVNVTPRKKKNRYGMDINGKVGGKAAKKKQEGWYLGKALGAKSGWWKSKPRKKVTKVEQYKLGQKSKSAEVRKATKAGALREGIITKKKDIPVLAKKKDTPVLAKKKDIPVLAKKIVKAVKTKGGEFPVFKSGTGEAKDFNEAFKVARNEGKKVFDWKGRKYNTKLEQEQPQKSGTPEAKDFNSAFRAARNEGKKVFRWKGKRYTTKLKK